MRATHCVHDLQCQYLQNLSIILNEQQRSVLTFINNNSSEYQKVLDIVLQSSFIVTVKNLAIIMFLFFPCLLTKLQAFTLSLKNFCYFLERGQHAVGSFYTTED